MEQHLNENNNENPRDLIKIPQESILFFQETGKWTKLLAIVGFVFIGFMVLAAFTMGTVMSSFGGAESFPFQGILMGGIYLLMALLYYFPVMYLYKFSTNIKRAFVSMDSASFNSAIRNLKSHYKYIGIFTVISLAIYVMLLIGFAGVAFAM